MNKMIKNGFAVKKFAHSPRGHGARAFSFCFKRTSPLANAPFGLHIEGMESTNVIPFPQRNAPSYDLVSFHRRELADILSIYGQLVAAGEWRDYAINTGRDVATFSVFRRMGETPAYRIEKRPKNAAKQGAYCIFSSDGQVLKRGADLKMTLRIFNRKLLKLADKD